MAETRLIQEIVDQVLKRLSFHQQKALCLFCGGSIGAEEARSELKKLQELNWELRVAFTKNGSQVLGEEWLISELGSGLKIISEDSNPGLVLKEIDTIFIPVLTINTAAKIVCGIADNLVTTLVLDGLLSGKTIVAARDACDPSNPVRQHLGMGKGPESLINVLQNNLKRLQEFGIQLVWAQELSKTARSLSAAQDKEQNQGANSLSEEEKIFNGRVLSKGVLMSWPGEKMVVGKNTLITPLAHEIAQDRRISIVREGSA